MASIAAAIMISSTSPNRTSTLPQASRGDVPTAHDTGLPLSSDSSTLPSAPISSSTPQKQHTWKNKRYIWIGVRGIFGRTVIVVNRNFEHGISFPLSLLASHHFRNSPTEIPILGKSHAHTHSRLWRARCGRYATTRASISDG
jgi:hypothetical protein